MAGLQAGFTLDAAARTLASGRVGAVAALLAQRSAPLALDRAGRTGLSRGERAMATAAAARLIGCPTTTADAARVAADSLRRHRDVQVMLEEGIPSPLTGRLGAIVSAAGALTRSPPHLPAREIWRLEEAVLDEEEIVDLILAAAFASWTTRLTLGLLADPSPEEDRP